MSKTRRQKPARSAAAKPAPAAPATPAPAAAPPPATTLIEFTERGIDALRTNRRRAESGRSTARDDKRRAFEEAIARLKADYAEVLRRRD